MRKLYIGNKNYSSWSMRPWVLMTQAGIPFEEVMVRFDSFDAGSAFKQAVGAQNPVGKVPVLVEDDGFAVWDTLAIAETLAERFPDRQLWPADPGARARARERGRAPLRVALAPVLVQHRGANRHPRGMFHTVGTTPSMAASRSPLSRFSRSRVRCCGVRGAATSSSSTSSAIVCCTFRAMMPNTGFLGPEVADSKALAIPLDQAEILVTEPGGYRLVP